MTKLIDTNIIIRYLIGDNQKLLEESLQIFKQISKAELKVHILDTVLMECLFVLIKFYKLPKNEIINDLKKILSLKGVVNSNKIILFEALNIFENKNLDFVDSLICAKFKLENYEFITFDKEMNKKCI